MRGIAGRLRGVLTLALIVAGVLATASPTATAAQPQARPAADRDCSDFGNQAEAQRYFRDRGGPDSDPDRLDADGDGKACDSLPCPCGTGGGGPAPKPKRARTILTRVVSVTDGDTLKVRYGKTRRTIRIVGVDTPETKRPGVGVECGGPQASANLKRLAPAGARVSLRTDPTQDTIDRYGRLLAYVGRKGRDLGRTQIAAGWAKTYVYAGKPFQRTAAYRRSQKKAKRLGRGVHGQCGGDFHSDQADASATRRRTRITAMRMRLRGIGDPGSGYDVQIAIRVRVCGSPDTVAFHITETASPPDRNRPVFARQRRSVTQDQLGRCDTHRITWILQDKFFGVSRYRVSLRARTTDRAWSRVASRHVDTYD